MQDRRCATCIYKKSSPLDLAELENQCRDERGDLQMFRICHHSDDVCCRGFWDAHRDDFPLGQIAQRLDMVEFVNVDTLREKKR